MRTPMLKLLGAAYLTAFDGLIFNNTEATNLAVCGEREYSRQVMMIELSGV